MQAEIQLLDLSLIDDHPDNPRLVLRDDVIDGIAASLNGEYPQKHAVHVRPHGERFQILSGHHRKRAATKAKIKKVWAWVENLDDDAAFMELALSNRQGELSPLEIGMHALKAVPLEKGGRGKKGGLSEYAEKIGQKVPNLTAYRHGAEVVQAVNPYINIRVLLGKAVHLAAIHSAPPECWPVLVEALVKAEWSASDTAAIVRDLAKAIERIPEVWRNLFIPPDKLAAEIAAGRTVGAFERLASRATEIQSWLNEHAGNAIQRRRAKPSTR